MSDPTNTVVIGREARQYGCFSALNPMWLSSGAEMRDFVHDLSGPALWIGLRAPLIRVFLGAIDWRSPKNLGKLVLLDHVHCETAAALYCLFSHIALTDSRRTVLRAEELVAVLMADNKRDLFITGMLDERSQLLMLWRGNLRCLPVPLRAFKESAGSPHPDWNSFQITDYGQTLAFGDYEASADAVLYEFDPDYRRRLNQRRRSQEKGFGPSLRRLRKQKRLRRGDFPGLSAKTIARIERGEVAKPHRRTVSVLADRLGVLAEEIETY